MRAPLIVAGVVVAALFSLDGPGRAAVPPPTSTTAVINIRVGGDRDTATTMTRLPGVSFGLFSRIAPLSATLLGAILALVKR